MEPESNAAEQLKLYYDFTYFCEKILHLEMTEYHKGIADLPLKHRYLCIVIPTGHSKTTLFTMGYALWRLWREKNIEICLVSSSVDQSMRMFALVQEELQTNPFFKDLLPTDRFDTWNKSQLRTRNGNQYYIKPFNSTARGIHPQYIIYDDLLRESDTPMDQIKEIFWSVFYPRGQIHKCQHLVVGTPQGLDDLYAELAKKEEWHVVRKAAIDVDWTKPLWPERFPIDVLRKIRDSMAPYRFEREYMCRPSPTGTPLVSKEQLLNCLDENLEFGFEIKGVGYLGCDFAMSTQASGDFNVFTVVDSVVGETYEKKTDKGIVKIENPVFVRKITRFKGAGQIDSIRQLNEYYKPAKIIADNSGVGAKFVQELRENQISVYGQDFQPANRNMLLLNLGSLIEKGRLVIPAGSESSFMSNNLIREISGFGLKRTKSNSESFHSSTEHDDMCISLALAVKDISNPRKMLSDIFYGA